MKDDVPCISGRTAQLRPEHAQSVTTSVTSPVVSSRLAFTSIPREPPAFISLAVSSVELIRVSLSPDKMGSSSALSPAKIPPRLNSICERLAARSSKMAASEYLDLYTRAHQVVPQTILDRKPPYMNQQELVTVMDAKLAFGVNRPALKGMIAKLTEGSVVDASKRAFQMLSQRTGPTTTTTTEDMDHLKEAMKALCVLRGVGPATASLVLSLVSPDVPFFSDEAAVSVIKPRDGRKGLKYTDPHYWAFFEGVCEECVKADEAIKPREWERSTWADSVLGGSKDSVNIRKRPVEDIVESEVDRDDSGGADDKDDGDSESLERKRTVEKKKKAKIEI